MIEVQEIRQERKFDIGICAISGQKKKWNDGCRDGFKCREHISKKPYMVCMHCVEWEGRSKLEQSRLNDEKEKIPDRYVTMEIL